MWGAMVHRAGVGPEPCRVDKLTANILAQKLAELKDEGVREKAVSLSVSMKSEDGVQGGLQHFLDFLPRDNMLCDVSLLLGETNLACYRILSSDIKIGLEVASTLREKQLRTPKSGIDFFVNALISVNTVLSWFNPSGSSRQARHAICSYALGRVHTFGQGIAAGWFGLLRELFRGLFEAYLRPDKFARRHGALGCLFGLAVAPFFILYDLLRGFLIFLDRIFVGIGNGCCGKDHLFLIDPTVRAHVYQTPNDLDELLNYSSISESRRDQLRYAVRLANNASALFSACNPKFPDGQWHWLEADASKLKEIVVRQGKNRLVLKDDEYEILVDCLDKSTKEQISLSRFCLYLGLAVKTRLERLNRAAIRNNPDFNTATTMLPQMNTPVGVIDDEENDSPRLSINIIARLHRKSHQLSTLNRIPSETYGEEDQWSGGSCPLPTKSPRSTTI